VSDARRISSNAGYLAALTASNYLLGLLIFPYLARVLSVEAFGLVGFSMTFVLVFQVVVEYGFMISATAEISARRDDRHAIGRIIATTMLAKLILGTIAVAAFFAAAAVVPTVRDHMGIVGLFLVASILAAMLPDFYFRGTERMRPIGVRALVSRSLAIVLIIALVHDDYDLALVPIALGCGNILAIALGFAWIARAKIPLPRPTLRDALRSLRDGAGFFASRVAASVNQSAGSFVLGLQFTPTSQAMGLFAGASRIASAGELAVTPIADAVYPHMIARRDYSMFWRVYVRGLALWTIGCAAVVVWAKPICTLVLGEEFAGAAGTLRILTIGVFFAYSSTMFGYAALSPLSLAKHANTALVVSATWTVVAFSVLWASGRVEPTSVAIVVASASIVTLAYRFAIFMGHREQWARASSSGA